MKILLVTGKLAEELVRNSSPTVDVHVCDVDVAAFITPELLEDVALENYDLILVPGLTSECNWEEFEHKKGVKVRLGPLHAYDLREVVKYVDKIELSHKIPACRLIESKRAEEVIKTVDELEKDYAFKIREVKIGGN
ncbi:MAG: dihydropteroate synthase-like protein, partial [Archaeoglobaceae archaeon]|nr:dihydropteroate synthase-like protein [Archaeoglobaceae archaeon]MDW8118667.1 dihydropteroate synthase-like protein [Archaeoglobaceae archaeon]